MTYKDLDEKRKYLRENIDKLPKELLENYESNFDIEYTHNSTAIEGNTLSLLDTKMVIEEGITIGGKELREIYEVTNHNNAYKYIKECVKQNKDLTEDVIKDIHNIVMKDIMIGGIYRSVDVYISGAKHIPPTPNDAYNQLRAFYSTLESNKMEGIELAAYTHAEFVKIHPFVDGNGRTSRLIMNYQLIKAGFLPVNIKKEDRFRYYDSLEKYAIDNDISEFENIIKELENMELDRYIKAIKDSV